MSLLGSIKKVLDWFICKIVNRLFFSVSTYKLRPSYTKDSVKVKTIFAHHSHLFIAYNIFMKSLCDKTFQTKTNINNF